MRHERDVCRKGTNGPASPGSQRATPPAWHAPFTRTRRAKKPDSCLALSEDHAWNQTEPGHDARRSSMLRQVLLDTHHRPAGGLDRIAQLVGCALQFACPVEDLVLPGHVDDIGIRR